MRSAMASMMCGSSPLSRKASGMTFGSVGSTTAIQARNMSELVALVAAAENFWSGWNQPPRRKQHPRTRRRLLRMEPRREAVTTKLSSGCVRPFQRKTIAMIISTALPNVAFRSPPIWSPHRSATSSVRVPNMKARGTMPVRHRKNVGTSPQARKCERMPKGMQTNNTLNQLEMRIFLNSRKSPMEKMPGGLKSRPSPAPDVSRWGRDTVGAPPLPASAPPEGRRRSRSSSGGSPRLARRSRPERERMRHTSTAARPRLRVSSSSEISPWPGGPGACPPGAKEKSLPGGGSFQLDDPIPASPPRRSSGVPP